MFELRIFPDSIQVAKSHSIEILVFRQTSLNRDKFFTKKKLWLHQSFPGMPRSFKKGNHWCFHVLQVTLAGAFHGLLHDTMDHPNFIVVFKCPKP